MHFPSIKNQIKDKHKPWDPICLVPDHSLFYKHMSSAAAASSYDS